MLFSVENISYGWQGQDPLFENVNFNLKAGEIMAILGPNGVGKTTLLKSIMGFIPLKKGQIFFDKVNLENMPIGDFWKSVSYVPQAKSPTFGLTGFDMVLLGRNPHINFFSVPKAQDVQKTQEVFDLLGIQKLADKKINSISGGELQMLLLARALVCEPRLIILDEPESNLDFRNQLKILETLKRLSKEHQIACIFNTHYPAHASRIADRALMLGSKGQWTFGAVQDVLTEDCLESYFQVRVRMLEVEDAQDSWNTIIPLSMTEIEEKTH